MSKSLIVFLIVSSIILASVVEGNKKGTNIVVKDKHSKVILNSDKKGTDNIIIKDEWHHHGEHHHMPHMEHWGHGWGH